jgi:hypothetical protein
MIELAETSPDVDVQLAEYKRLLGYPRRQKLSDRARRLAHWARAWYARNSRPWLYAREAQSLELRDGSIVIDGHQFTSNRLHQAFELSEAHSAVLVAVGAGEEIEQKAQQAWRQGKPDEYFFLEVYGSAAVERLITMAGARICALVEAEQMAVLPHDSPGYSEWDIAEQSELLKLVRQTRERLLPGRLDALDSGMLLPKKSLLAIFGVTRHSERVARLANLSPCERCAFVPCQYRRQPYHRARATVQSSSGGRSNVKLNGAAAPIVPLDGNANYTVNTKALARWSDERLQLEAANDGSINAVFRYEGTTCTNQGRVLLFDYRVELGPQEEGYIIRSERCAPAPHDTGHAYMCRYTSDPKLLMSAIANEKPLLGRPLNDVLSWRPPRGTAGCYCEAADRTHKWRLVLETIHFALVRKERRHAEELAQPAETT